MQLGTISNKSVMIKNPLGFSNATDLSCIFTQPPNFLMLWYNKLEAVLNTSEYPARFGKQCYLASLFKKNSPLCPLFVYEPIKKDPELFDSTSSRIPIF